VIRDADGLAALWVQKFETQGSAMGDAMGLHAGNNPGSDHGDALTPDTGAYVCPPFDPAHDCVIQDAGSAASMSQ
jgi:hypothetical protein